MRPRSSVTAPHHCEGKLTVASTGRAPCTAAHGPACGPPRDPLDGQSKSTSLSTTAWWCCSSGAEQRRASGRRPDNLRNSSRIAAFSSSSARLRLRNISHRMGSWPYQRRSTVRGATSRIHRSMAALLLRNPRGHALLQDPGATATRGRQIGALDSDLEPLRAACHGRPHPVFGRHRTGPRSRDDPIAPNTCALPARTHLRTPAQRRAGIRFVWQFHSPRRHLRTRVSPCECRPPHRLAPRG